MACCFIIQENAETIVNVLVGAFIAGCVTILVDVLRGKREYNLHLKQKKEEVYLNAIRICSNILTTKVYQSQVLSEQLNELNNISNEVWLWGSEKILHLYNTVHQDIVESKSDSEKKLDELVNAMRSELGIKS